MKKILFLLPLLLLTMCDKNENELGKDTRNLPADSDSVKSVGITFKIDTGYLDTLYITF